MKIDILTLFPEMFTSFLDTSIIKRAISKDAVVVNTHDIRSFTLDKYGRVDDYTCGGGAGLIMKPQPIIDCLNSVKKEDSYVVLMTPRGEKYTQRKAHELAKKPHLIFICGHYEGIDERVNKHIDEQISIGDFILTGGELAAMVVSDSIIRLQDGAISNESLEEESFESGLLEYPQYTLPRVYDNDEIPDILFSGNHTAIRKWRLKESLRITLKNRPDLLENRKLTKEETKLLDEIKNGIEEPEWLVKAIKNAKKFM
jgi:tRNA (guanine37-N1)-methyltransferase